MAVSELKVMVAANYIKALSPTDARDALRRLGQRLPPAMRRDAIAIWQSLELEAVRK